MNKQIPNYLSRGVVNCREPIEVISYKIGVCRVAPGTGVMRMRPSSLRPCCGVPELFIPEHSAPGLCIPELSFPELYLRPWMLRH
jgi:hypothetical protein